MTDGQGNQTKENFKPISLGWNTYKEIKTRAYGAFNEITNFTLETRATDGGALTQATSYKYYYRPDGVRWGKENLDPNLQSNQLEWFVSVSSNILAEYRQTAGSQSYELKAVNVPGLGIDDHIARVDVLDNNTIALYLNNAIGSTHQMVRANGTIVNQDMTTPWGKEIPGYSFTSQVPNRYGLTGQERDKETASAPDPTGEMHYRARGYSPRQMRFLQNDPPVGRRAENHYAYVGNNPVSAVDPQGEDYTKIVEKDGVQVVQFVPEGIFGIDQEARDIGIYDSVTEQVLFFKEGQEAVSIPYGALRQGYHGTFWDSSDLYTSDKWYDWAKTWRESQPETKLDRLSALRLAREGVPGAEEETKTALPNWENLYVGMTQATRDALKSVGFDIGAMAVSGGLGEVLDVLIAFRKAQKLSVAGRKFAERADIATSFANKEVLEVTLEYDLKVRRVFGGQSQKEGRWWTTARIENSTTAKEGLALPGGNAGTGIVEGVIPKGTKIYVGKVAKAIGRAGGLPQIFIEDGKVVKYGTERPLE